MKIVIRAYTEKDLPAMVEIWNQVVEDGVAFPQEDALTLDTIPGGFRMKDGHYEDICPYYHTL